MLQMEEGLDEDRPCLMVLFSEVFGILIRLLQAVENLRFISCCFDSLGGHVIEKSFMEIPHGSRGNNSRGDLCASHHKLQLVAV